MILASQLSFEEAQKSKIILTTHNNAYKTIDLTTKPPTAQSNFLAPVSEPEKNLNS